MTDIVELLPCPFCGSEGQLDDWGKQKFAYCPNDECFVQPETGTFERAEDAVAKWNTRAAYEAMARSDGVRGALEAADKRLCELTPSFPPDVGPDMRDAAGIEETGAVVMQIRDALKTIGSSGHEG